MAQQIKLKRSAVAGRIPTTSSLDLGEIAVNTADGKLYFQRGDSTIQSFFTTNALITGSLQQSGSDSYFLSNVGIGTDAPSTELEVSGTTTVQAVLPSTDSIYNLGSSSNRFLYTYSRYLDSGINTLELRSGATMLFKNGGTERMRIDSAGNVGIGTTSPAYALDVNADNIRVGAHTIGIAGSATTSSLAIGQDALGSYSGIYSNTAIGWKALSLVTGGPNDAIGAESLRYSIDATYNTAIGLAAGYRSQGTQNTFIGQYSGPYYSDVTGGYNTFIGPLVGLFSSGSSQRNTGIGANALYSFTNANSNTALGSTAGFDLTTGGSNTFIGDAAGRGITTGTGNTVIGRISGLSSTLSGVVIIGDGNGNQRIYVDNGGNLGIGTTSPAEKLTVEGNISASGDLYLDGAIFDSSDTSGSLGQVLTSIAGGTAWEDIDTAVLDEVENIYATVKNISGGTLFKGTPVHAVSGSSSGNVNPVIAASASDATTMPATFILNQDINDEAEGQAIIAGHIEGVDTSLFNVGDIVYVGESGGYTNVKPTGSANLIQNLGVVTKVHASNGSGIIYGSGRSNDIPNLPVGKIWVGSDNYSVTSSVVHLDETNGRMGIGTTSPQAKLDVSGSAQFHSVDIFKADATANPRLRIGRSTAETLNFDVDDYVARIYHKQDETGTQVHKLNLTVDSDSTAGSEINLGFRDSDGSNESTKLIISSSGYVGIGTTTPETQLDITGDLTIGGKIYTRADGNRNTYIDSGTDLWRFYGGGNELLALSWTGGAVFNEGGADRDFRVESDTNTHMLFVDAGNDRVGIGTASPSEKLDIAGNIRLSGNIVDANTGENIEIGTNDIRVEHKHLAAEFGLWARSSTLSSRQMGIDGFATYMGLYTNGSEKVRITQTGNVGIGVNNPSDFNSAADNLVVGTGTGTNGITIYSDTLSGIYFADESGSGAGNRDGVISYNHSSARMDLKTGGNQGVLSLNTGTSTFHLGDVVMENDLTVKGIVTAKEFHTEFVSASIVYSSGSTKFGDTSDDLHQFTGSLDVSGSIESFGKLTFTSTTSNSIDSIVNLTLNADSDSNSGDAYRNIIFSNRGSEKARIDADGNVGIGTTTPSYKLTVGDSSGGDGTTAGIAGFYGQHASSPGLLQINYDTDGSGETSVKFGGNGMISARGGIFNFNTSGKDISFAVNNEGNANVSNAALYISSSGDAIFQNNVGIGTTSPSEKLEVVGSVLVEGNSDSRLYLGSNIGQKFSLGTVHDGTYDSMFIEYSALGVPKILTLRGNGNVGIGTTSPSEKLEVNGNVQVTSGSLTLDGPTPLFYLKDSTLGTTHLLNSNNSELQIKGDQAIEIFANNTSSIYIASDGDVGIGTTSPQMPLHVAGKVRVDDDLYIISNDPTIFFADSNGTPDYSINANGGFFRITDSTNNAVRLIVGNTGNVGIGTTTPSVKLHVSDATAPSFRLSRTGTGQIWEQGIDSSGRFQLKEAASEGGTQYTRLQVDDTGEVQFGAYGSGTITGTAAYTLAVDSSGNIIEVDTSNINAGENTDVDTGTEVVDTFSSGSGASAFTNYVVNDGTNYRAGQLMTVWNTAGSIEYTDVSTNSIGDTSEVYIFAAVNGADIEIKATVPSDNWVVRVNSTLL